MSIALNNTQPIDPNNPAFKKMLNDLQGNILSSHGRDHSVLLFLRFIGDAKAVRAWIRTFAASSVTSAQQQLAEAKKFQTSRIGGKVFGNFLLTRDGYDFLGGLQLPQDPSFQAGLKAVQEKLRDPASTQWGQGFQGAIHGLILLADDDEATLSAQSAKVQHGLTGVAVVTDTEVGRALRNRQGDHIEHFGYVDGRSQPIFLKDAYETEARVEGVTNWDPFASLGLVLVPDPNAKTEDAFGSYFVFRKLEQNVRGFKEMEGKLAQTLGLKDDDAERAGALVVGRFEDGTPVTLQKEEGMSHPVPNNFNYEADAQALKCPFHAHIRKTNPRGDTVRQFGVPAESERSHRIARRGIPYGTRTVEPKDDPALEQMPIKDVGLLFMCFQSNIAEQFEFIQAAWANSEDFVRPGTGVDPVIGQSGASQPHQWPTEWAGHATRPFGDFHDFVTMKGGEYFFAPSIGFLKNL